MDESDVAHVIGVSSKPTGLLADRTQCAKRQILLRVRNSDFPKPFGMPEMTVRSCHANLNPSLPQKPRNDPAAVPLHNPPLPGGHHDTHIPPEIQAAAVKGVNHVWTFKPKAG
jgi:hypothetical protein